jgi:hypothetical protein
MEKLDRLGWAGGMSLVSFGVRIGIRVNRPEILGRLKGYLPPGWKPSSSNAVDYLYSLIVGGVGAKPNVRRFNLLYAGIVRLARSTDIDQVLQTLESDLQLYVAQEARRRVFVHAGVVGYGGRAVIIPGRSFSGKSTLVAELVKAGATYYSDEYAVLDARGRVHPYTRPLGIRENGTGTMKKHSVQDLGGSPGVKSLAVGLVVVSAYKQGARWRPRELSEGEGALELVANTVCARSRPGEMLQAIRGVVSHAPVLKSDRGEARDVVDFILERMSG